MNVKGKETMANKLTEVLIKILDRCKVSNLIPLTWKNNLIKQIDTPQENKSLQVETINDNPNNNCEESKGKGISDPNSDYNENKHRLSKRHRKCLKSKNEEFLWNYNQIRRKKNLTI
jgi:hypothetical protein